MSAIWRSLLRDERGFVITAELVLISTVLVLGLVAALSAVKAAVAGELGDVADAIGSLNQTYYTHGFHGCRSGVAGSAYLDEADSSDELKADFATAINTSCTPAVLPVPAAPCGTPPCPTPCDLPCPTLPAIPCDVPCASPCASPCQTTLGCGTCGVSVPRMICPPGPGPFNGTDPFAPGAVSPRNMLRNGISYGGVCAPPGAQLPVPCIEPAVDPAPYHFEQPCPPTPVISPACCETPVAPFPQTSTNHSWEAPPAVFDEPLPAPRPLPDAVY